MAGKAGFQKVGSCLCLLLPLCVSFINCGTLGSVQQGKVSSARPDTNTNANKSNDTLYYLDISKPSISQSIEPAKDDADEAKFVQVEVVEVLNPQKYSLSFEVRYQPRSNEEVYLGSFSLYPADNPGKFIVATQGKVKNEGVIVLSMVIADKVAPATPVRVGVKRIRFLKR